MSINQQILSQFEDMEHKEAVFKASLDYASQGLFVVPLRINGKLLPKSKTNVNYGSASRRREVMEKWFHPETGKFAGWNIGLACGRAGGIFAVDIDMHGDVDGIKTWEGLLAEHEDDDIECPMQETPSGGFHLIFKWQDNAVSSTGKLGKGIDTRGGEENKCKSHIAVFPSKVDGKAYKWVTGGEIPHVPQWVMDSLGVAWRSDSGSISNIGKVAKARGSEEMDSGDIETQIPLEQVSRMLKYIDANDLNYDEWLRIGQAINSQHPTDEGLVVWDGWSSGGTRYKPDECVIRWRGFSPMGTVRMGTLFFYAIEGGWSSEPEDVLTSKYDIAVAELNKTFAIVLVGNKIRIAYEKDYVVDDFMSHYELLNKDDFSLLLSNRTMVVNDARGTPKRIPLAQIWLASDSRRTYTNGIGLFPEKDVPGFYNTWRGFSVSPVEGFSDPIIDFIKLIICTDMDNLSVWVLDWLADLVQDPANPKGCAIIMRGQEGIGKGFLGNLVCSLFGFHARHLIDDSHLTGNFNAHMIDALVVFADEVTWGGNKKTAGKLKGMVTERYLLGERKGVDATPYRNMIHLMIASNEDWVIPAGPQSRRWLVLDVSNEKLGDKEYFDDLKYFLDNGGREAFLYYLMNRNITSNLTRAPETVALLDQRARQSQNDPLIVWWSQILESGVAPTCHASMNDDERELEEEWPEMIPRVRAFQEYEGWCLERKHRPVINSLFYKRMGVYGLGQIRKGKGSDSYKFTLPCIDDAVDTFKKETSIDVKEQ